MCQSSTLLVVEKAGGVFLRPRLASERRYISTW